MSTVLVYAQVSQDGSLQFEQLSVEHGLSNSLTDHIIQDRYGFIWVATADGLNRYDGKSIKVYKNTLEDTTSIGNNEVISLIETNDGTIWVGTRSGVSIYHYETDEFTHVDHPFVNEKLIIEMIADENGVIWLGTYDGLVKYENDEFIAYFHDPKDTNSLSHNQIFDIRKIGGALYVGTYDGLNILDIEKKHFSKPSQHGMGSV